MSLAVLADHMASKGRGPDTMLIHMAPSEVQGLQALAMAHGGSLTINPETGLPEAGFLDKLLPTIIGAGISFFSGGTIDPMTAAAMVGGVETVRTGDLGRGISAGLGAYGGASLTAGMTGAGSTAMANEAGALAGSEAAAYGASQGFSQEAIDAFRRQAIDEGTLQQGMSELTGKTTTGELFSKGVDVAKNDPMGYLKANAKPLMYAAGPAILAGMSAKSNMPQTVTQQGQVMNYGYDPISGTFTSAGGYKVPVKQGAEGGLMGMNDGGYAPGQLNFAQQSEPVMRMAEGGIAGYAIGGTTAADLEAAYAAKDYSKVNEIVQANHVTEADIQNQWKGLDTSGLAGLGVNLAKPYEAYTDEQIGSYFTTNPTANVADSIKQFNADPNQVNRYISNIAAPFIGSTETTGGSGTLGIYNQMNALGIDPNELYASRIAADPKYAGWSQADIARGYALDKGALALSAADKDGVTDKEWAAFMDANKYSVNDMAQAFGLSIGEVQRRYDAAKKKPLVTCGPGFKLSTDGLTCVPDTKVVTPETQCPTGYHYDPVLKQCVLNTSATQNTTTGVGTPTDISTASKSSLPVGISGAGITTINPNGTVTTRPDIPGIPEGGFTGSENLRDVYTKGGGSLGYVPYAPKDIAAFETKYKNTGGSKQSYDYLMGKTPYSPTPYTATGEVMKPYAESVLGVPANVSKKMYLFDPVTKAYKINPDYAIPTYDKDGKKSYNVTNKDVTTFMDKSPSTDAFYTWATTNNLTPEQIAQASGRPITEITKLFTGAKDLVDDSGKIDQTKVDAKTAADEKTNFDYAAYLKANPDVQAELDAGKANFGSKDDLAAAAWEHYQRYGKAQKRPLKAAGGLLAEGGLAALTMARGGTTHMPFFSKSTGKFNMATPKVYADGGMAAGGQFDLGGYSDGGRLLRGPGDGVSDSIPATIGDKRPARLADGEFVVPARIVSELGNGSTEAGARKLYAMMDRVQAARKGSIGKGRVAKNSRADKYLPA